MANVAVEQAQRELAKLLDDVARGEHVVITRDDLPVAELVPVTPHAARATFGSARGMLQMADDFDAPIEDFREYMG